jgi:hypothetical protein
LSLLYPKSGERERLRKDVEPYIPIDKSRGLTALLVRNMPEGYTTVPFTPQDVKAYLDKEIRYWRNKRTQGVELSPQNEISAASYIDAYQSVRKNLFGEWLPQGEEK